MNDVNLGTVARFCADIGMLALDRAIASSCVHKTTTCERECFNNKFYGVFGRDLREKDVKNDLAWYENDTSPLVAKMSRMRRQTKRARLMTRGEAFRDYGDIERVARILEATPNTVWWVPTRSWRHPVLFAMVRTMIAQFQNVRLQASMDNSNTLEEWDHVLNMGLSTMYFDEGAVTSVPTTGDRMFKCPKTHRHITGHCATCKAGCFFQEANPCASFEALMPWDRR